MATYYVAPHHLFDMGDIDQDFDLSCFVLAEDTKHAANLWCDFVEFTTEVTLLVDQIVSPLNVPVNYGKDTIVVHLIGPKLEQTGFGFVPWDQFPFTYVTVKES